MAQHVLVPGTFRSRRNALLALLIAAALLLPLCRPPATAGTPSVKTARRRSVDCEYLLIEKRLLGYDVSRTRAAVNLARKIGLAGDLAGALAGLDQAIDELRRSDYPFSGPTRVTMITGTPLPSEEPEDQSGATLSAGSLDLRFNGSGRITGVALGQREVGSAVAGGFYALDASTGRGGPLSGTLTKTGEGVRLTGDHSAIQTGIDVRIMHRDGRLAVEGTLRDRSGTDRAIVLCFKIPLRAEGFQWWDDADLALNIPASDCILQNSAQATLDSASARLVSIYPLACVSDQRSGLVLATAIDHPAVFRLNYDGRDQSLNLYYEFGLTSKTAKFPGEARFRFTIYGLEDPAWGFRSALDSYYKAFPEAFATTAGNAGLWGMMEAAATLGEEYKEMGFAYLQGENDDTQWGRKLGLWSMRYCRPWSFFVPGPTKAEKGRLAQLAANPEALNLKSAHHLIFGPVSGPELISAVKLSAIHDHRGEPVAESDPVLGGVSYILNPDPEIEGPPGVRNTARVTLEQAIEPTVRDRYQARGQTRWGLFFDVAGSQLKHENFRQDHMAFADYPLTFDENEKRPVILGLSSACEYLAQVRAYANREGGIVGVNTSPHPYNMVFLAPFCDMAGTEHLPHRREMNNRRALAHGKPIAFRTEESWGDLLKTGLFYGVFPSRRPSGNVRTKLDHLKQAKPLLIRVVPLIKLAATAGWEPVTRARTGDPNLLVERFGRFEGEGPVYFTAWNRTASVREVTLSLDKIAGRWCGARPKAAELAGGRDVSTTAETVRFRLGADEVALIRLDAAGEEPPRPSRVTDQ